MKEERFYKLMDNVFVQCLDIMKSKGTAYSGVEDKLGNFKRVAKNLGMTPEAVWYVYFAKHLDALSAYLRGEYVDSEPIEGRIKDLINYLFLFYALLIEDQEDTVTKKQKLRGETVTTEHSLEWVDLPDNYVSGTNYEGRIIVVDDEDEKDE